jgi:soluble lytic murein transglycosylase
MHISFENKRTNKRVLIFLALTLSLFSLVLASKEYVRNTSNLAAIQQRIQEHEGILSVDQERQASLKKVLDIISRYNKKMDGELKHAIANEVYLMSKKYSNLNIDFISATITHESARTWDPRVTSNVGAMGLMQIMPTTGAFLAVSEGMNWTTAEEVLYDPINNIQLGCRYLSDLVGMYEQDGALAAYNGGPRRAEMWLAANRNNNILFAETRDYIPAVLKLYDEFKALEVL